MVSALSQHQQYRRHRPKNNQKLHHTQVQLVQALHTDQWWVVSVAMLGQAHTIPHRDRLPPICNQTQLHTRALLVPPRCIGLLLVVSEELAVSEVLALSQHQQHKRHRPKNNQMPHHTQVQLVQVLHTDQWWVVSVAMSGQAHMIPHRERQLPICNQMLLCTQALLVPLMCIGLLSVVSEESAVSEVLALSQHQQHRRHRPKNNQKLHHTQVQLVQVLHTDQWWVVSVAMSGQAHMIPHRERQLPICNQMLLCTRALLVPLMCIGLLSVVSEELAVSVVSDLGQHQQHRLHRPRNSQTQPHTQADSVQALHTDPWWVVSVAMWHQEYTRLPPICNQMLLCTRAQLVPPMCIGLLSVVSEELVVSALGQHQRHKLHHPRNSQTQPHTQADSVQALHTDPWWAVSVAMWHQEYKRLPPICNQMLLCTRALLVPPMCTGLLLVVSEEELALGQHQQHRLHRPRNSQTQPHTQADSVQALRTDPWWVVSVAMWHQEYMRLHPICNQMLLCTRALLVPPMCTGLLSVVSEELVVSALGQHQRHKLHRPRNSQMQPHTEADSVQALHTDPWWVVSVAMWHQEYTRLPPICNQMLLCTRAQLVPPRCTELLLVVSEEELALGQHQQHRLHRPRNSQTQPHTEADSVQALHTDRWWVVSVAMWHQEYTRLPPICNQMLLCTRALLVPPMCTGLLSVVSEEVLVLALSL